jgi:hypothetical protein
MPLSSQPAKAPPMHRQSSDFGTQEPASSSSNVTTMSNPSSTSNAPNSLPSTFEFTKRKRWADLLIHELSEAIIFVLSNQCKVLFCSRAVSELLGWRDAELIDKDLVDLVNGEYACCVSSTCNPRVLICHRLLQAKISRLSVGHLTYLCARARRCYPTFGSSAKPSTMSPPGRFSSK